MIGPVVELAAVVRLVSPVVEIVVDELAIKVLVDPTDVVDWLVTGDGPGGPELEVMLEVDVVDKVLVERVEVDEVIVEIVVMVEIVVVVVEEVVLVVVEVIV